jgi:hypothetical protein
LSPPYKTQATFADNKTLKAIQESIDGKTIPTTIAEIMAEINEAEN